MARLWKIDELAALVEQALATAGYDGQKSGRVRGIPDSRTIRYYTTLGLLDKPAEMRGRTAFYGSRHLKQLVAIKRLQAHGSSLLEIQKALAGADESVLRKWSALPGDFWEAAEKGRWGTTEFTPPLEQQTEPQRQSPTVGSAKFWEKLPELARSTGKPADSHSALETAIHVTLLPGVKLLFEGDAANRLDPQTLRKLAPAFETLKKALEEGGIAESGLEEK